MGLKPGLIKGPGGGGTPGGNDGGGIVMAAGKPGGGTPTGPAGPTGWTGAAWMEKFQKVTANEYFKIYNLIRDTKNNYGIKNHF